MLGNIVPFFFLSRREQWMLKRVSACVMPYGDLSCASGMIMLSENKKLHCLYSLTDTCILEYEFCLSKKEDKTVCFSLLRDLDCNKKKKDNVGDNTYNLL